MEMRKYEKPALRFVETRSNQEVANKCWGIHGKNESVYYDTDGAGYVSFQISGGSCYATGNIYNVIYYKDQDSAGVPLNSNDQQYQELVKVVESIGGNNGQPYKGGGLDFPDNPDPSWS